MFRGKSNRFKRMFSRSIASPFHEKKKESNVGIKIDIIKVGEGYKSVACKIDRFAVGTWDVVLVGRVPWTRAPSKTLYLREEGTRLV